MLRSHKKLTKKEMKKDPLIIFTARIIDYLRKEWIKILSVVIGLIVIVSLSLFIVRGKNSAEINAFDIAMNAINNNEPEAMDLLDKFVNKYGGSKRVENALIQLGNYYFTQKDYDSAESYYNEYIKKFSDNPIYGFNAYNGLGGVFEEKGDFSKAGKIYEDFISKYNYSVFMPIMYLNAGKAFYLAGDKDSALRNFNKIKENYGDSKEQQEAIFYIKLLSVDSTGVN